MPEPELPALLIDGVTAVSGGGRIALVNRDPAPGEEDAPIDTTIALEVVDPGEAGIDRGATRVWVDGRLAFAGGEDPEFAAEFAGPRAAVLATADTLRIVLDPAEPLASQATVEVRVISATNGREAHLEEVYSFSVEDRTAPRVVAVQAIGPRRVRIAFDEEVSVGTRAGFTFEALSRPAVTPEVVGATARGTILTLDLAAEMTPDAAYLLTATGVTDQAGNGVLPPFDRATFKGFRPQRPRGRRFDLWSMLPEHNRRSDATGDLSRFTACLQEVTDLLLAEVDRFPDLFDLERAPEALLDAILADLGNPFFFDLDALGKRRLAAVLVEIYRLKGTAVGIRNAVRFFVGVDVEAITPFSGSTLTLGESELGVDWELGPSDRFARYAFEVRVGAPLSECQKRQIRAMVEYLKPVGAHCVGIIEPSDPPAFDHWELGTSELSFSTILS